MDEPKTVVILGCTTIDADADEMFRDIGSIIYRHGKQLVTTRTKGVADAVAAGFRLAGGIPAYLAEGGDAPDHDRVLVFADNAFKERLDDRVPDWDTRGWLVYVTHFQWFEFYYALGEFSTTLLNPPKDGSGEMVGQGRRPRRPRR